MKHVLKQIQCRFAVIYETLSSILHNIYPWLPWNDFSKKPQKYDDRHYLKKNVSVQFLGRRPHLMLEVNNTKVWPKRE